MRHPSFSGEVTRDAITSWYRAARLRSQQLFSIPVEEAYYDRPIALRNPIVFYEGHLPAFNVNTLIKLGLKSAGIDERFEVLFARGIDPADEAAAKSPTDLWPERRDVKSYGMAADMKVGNALNTAELERDDVAVLRGGEAVFTILEHEQMHHETLLYMLHNLPYEKKRPANPPNGPASPAIANAVQDLVAIPAGVALLGAEGAGFGWDNEFPAHRIDVPAFSIQRHSITNGEFLEFVDAGGYDDASLWTEEGWRWIRLAGIRHPHYWLQREGQWYWRGMFELFPLPLSWPAWVTHAEGTAYAKWRGMRLPTEAEYHRAAFGTPSGLERMFPWGDELPDATRGNFDFVSWDPMPAGSFPAGASAWGVHDLVGNGWEWTSTAFGGFDGFEPMPSYPVYSADFFDGRHFVMKGASPVTARELVRRSFRNWFRPEYPYVFAKFRCVQS